MQRIVEATLSLTLTLTLTLTLILSLSLSPSQSLSLFLLLLSPTLTVTPSGLSGIDLTAVRSRVASARGSCQIEGRVRLRASGRGSFE